MGNNSILGKNGGTEKHMNKIEEIFKEFNKDRDWLEKGKYLVKTSIKDLEVIRKKIFDTYRDEPDQALKNFDRMVKIKKDVNTKTGKKLGIPDEIIKQMNYEIDMWEKHERSTLMRDLEGMKR